MWAPDRRAVALVIEDAAGKVLKSVDLSPAGDGYHSLELSDAGAGLRYRFRLDDEPMLYADPASRFQPEGPHGPSQLVDPTTFAWTDQQWPGAKLAGQVIYEMHIGTFTPEGTWAAAQSELEELADTGITVLEIMPVADFPGKFGWGYDGVNLFAPTRLYGLPDDFRRFVDRAHALGIAVILDVVYNHLGPDGNFLPAFAADYFTDQHVTDWGEPLNFYGKNSGPVREFFIANAAYWIREFHLDGLRIDATQNIYDTSTSHILMEVTRAVREAAGARETIVVAENEPQESRLVRSAERGGFGMDGVWNDDFHHSAMVVLSSRNEAYYTDYLGTPQEFISAAKWGYLYQGQYYKWQKKRRGFPALDVPASAFVTFIQNHDQIANSGRGLRCRQLTSPSRYRAMTGLLLLGPGTPMLFQGQEFGSSSPFYFFADHRPELAELVHKGRQEFMSQFRSVAQSDMHDQLAYPSDPETFQVCKLDFSEREKHSAIHALHRDLLALRRKDPVFSVRDGRVDGAVLGAEAFVLRYFAADGADRLLVVNFGRDLHLNPAPEPLLAPPENSRWKTLWSSEDTHYEGSGWGPLDVNDNWHIPGEATVALAPRPWRPEDDEAEDDEEKLQKH